MSTDQPTLADLSIAQGRLEGKLDIVLEHNKEIIQTLRDHLKEDDDRFEHHSGRISSVEKKINWFSGVGAALMAFISFLHFHFRI